MWQSIKTWFLSRIKAILLTEIDQLDRFEPVLADFVRQQVKPSERAKDVIAFAQAKLTELANKAFSWKWFGAVLLSAYKDEVMSQIQGLSKYEDMLINLMTQVSPEDFAKTVVDNVQNEMHKLVDKYLK